MWLTILGFFRNSVSVGTLSRYMSLGLLLISFSLGIALTMALGERNLAVSNLDNANTKIKEKDKTISDKDKQINSKTEELSGCLGQIQQLNQGISENALATQEEDKKGRDRAGERLDALPAMIESDRQAAATPDVTNIWMRELFK